MNLRFALSTLDCSHRRLYALNELRRAEKFAWADASFALVAGKPAVRLYAIVANQSTKVGVVTDVPQQMYSEWAERETYIALGEMLAVILLFKEFPEAFTDACGIATLITWVLCMP